MGTLYMPLIDNGMGLSRTSWAVSLASACILSLAHRQVIFESISFPYPDGAMQLATAAFLASEAEEMVVIDTDLIFTHEDLTKLLSHDVPLVFGLYPKKVTGLEFPVQSLDGDDQPFADDGRGDLREVARSARGFMRVHRSVFEKIAPHVPEYECAQTGTVNRLFWRTLPGGHSEDFAFCDLAREHGFKVLVDKTICLKHEGSATYPIKGTY